MNTVQKVLFIRPKTVRISTKSHPLLLVAFPAGPSNYLKVPAVTWTCLLVVGQFRKFTGSDPIDTEKGRQAS